jgi:molybdopterin converting factor subunit 1
MVKLLYFAWLKDRTGISEEEVALPEGVATVDALLTWLPTRGEAYADALRDPKVIRIAVNQEYARPGDPVVDGDEVALFPPVTGG